MRPQLVSFFLDAPAVYPAWVERKFDGVRCCIVVTATEARALSREGNPLRAGQVIADRIAKAAGPCVIDGELAADTFRRTLSAVKRGAGLELVFHAWDCLTLDEWFAGGSTRPLEARREALEALRGAPAVEVVTPVLVASEEALEAAYRRAVADHWEGLVLKLAGSGYECGKRSTCWQKLKPLPREEW